VSSPLECRGEFFDLHSGTIEISSTDGNLLHRFDTERSALLADQLASETSAPLGDIHVRGAVLAQKNVHRGIGLAVRVRELPQGHVCPERVRGPV
jgi:hypothetical protein